MPKPKTIYMDSEGGVVLPRSVQRAAGVKPGMTLRLSATRGRIVVQPELPVAKTDVKSKRRRVRTWSGS